MARIELDKAQHDLTEIGWRLQTWQVFDKTDSILIQRTRDYEMGQCALIMEALLYDVQPEHRLRLTVGRTAIRGSEFWKGAYDMYSETHRNLDPDTELVLERTQQVFMHKFWQPPKAELFVGDFSVLVGLSAVSKTLTEGGQLAVVAAPERN
jgi:hypothetical protein